jgi:hypothetical protein
MLGLVSLVLKTIGELAATRIGLVILTIGAGIIFYEGLPIGPLRYIPFVGHYLAMVVDGRVDRERQAAVDAIEAEARAAAMKAIEDRSEDNAEISKFDKMQLCQELGGRWIDTESRCD